MASVVNSSSSSPPPFPALLASKIFHNASISLSILNLASTALIFASNSALSLLAAALSFAACILASASLRLFIEAAAG